MTWLIVGIVVFLALTAAMVWVSFGEPKKPTSAVPVPRKLVVAEPPKMTIVPELPKLVVEPPSPALPPPLPLPLPVHREPRKSEHKKKKPGSTYPSRKKR